MQTPQVPADAGYRYYLPSFVTAQFADNPRPRKQSLCRACDDVHGLDATDRCRRYVGTSDSNGWPYCAECGHILREHRI